MPDLVARGDEEGAHRPMPDKKWALILGASSGFGEACCLEFAQQGYHIAGVHLDRKSTMANVHRLTAKIDALGVEAAFYNGNAADEEERLYVLDSLAGRMGQRDTVKVMLHSLAFGTLRPFVGERANLLPINNNIANVCIF